MVDETMDWKARYEALLVRDREKSRALIRARDTVTILEKELKLERELRADAEANSRRWHALLLEEKVSKL